MSHRSASSLLSAVPWWRRFLNLEDYSRLATAIALREIECGRNDAESDPDALRLSEAENALERGDVSSGWEFVNALDRSRIAGLPPEELAAVRVSVAEEVERKLSGWRKKAARRLLGDADNSGETARASVTEALYHVHSASENTFRKLAKLRNRLLAIGCSVFAFIAALLVLDAFTPLLSSADVPDGLLALSTACGLLGGILSVAYSAARWVPGRKLPEVRADFLVTMFRPVIGAALALPVLLLAASGVIVTPGGCQETSGWLVLAFLGGFSERWFLGAMGKLDGN